MLKISEALTYLKQHPHSKFNYYASMFYRFFGRNHIKGSNRNCINLANTYARHLKITIQGVGNVIDFGEGANYIQKSSIYIHGNNNRIILGERNYLTGADIYIEDDGNIVSLGNHNKMYGRTHIACIEGTAVSFKDGCLFSDHVVFRTGDSHAILDAATNVRVNPSKSIHIGNRVWFGNTTTILKGIAIQDDSIIGTGSIVSSDVESNTIVAGVPARVIKRGVRWNLQRK